MSSTEKISLCSYRIVNIGTVDRKIGQAHIPTTCPIHKRGGMGSTLTLTQPLVERAF
ncbi:hypothetical protein KDA_10630 [Dictyobacter alpinus]|uniref:Uncharacterized protein n=1 Tax=Dictyobacter alpinus TaxID=2014873 RepID=A0A402B2L0_9CHLR|nr:hypothetical protein KDA_10630 [Dictyobacter alpinus]